MEVDANGPLSPRQEIKSTPYSRLAMRAENLEGGTVDAVQIGVGGAMVIDANGSWVGPTLSVQWGDIGGIPSDLADGDDDTLSQLACLAGQNRQLGWHGLDMCSG